MSDRCKFCSAPVLWVVMPSGKKMPLDATPDPHGAIIVNTEGQGVVIGQASPLGGDRYTSHFATCPHAARHRRAKTSTRTTESHS